ncbi:MAG: AmmeMemoRadiSam system protein A [Deltaproteobacteria bacterium]|nr:AmmeMemoRadiSam system protein A [Deltaproteobacteria bacterium]
MALSESEKKALLDMARATIEGCVRTGKIPSFKADSPGLSEARGAFVTIKKGGNLRGCIGVFDADKPLYETVREMAISAATRDPRFQPVWPAELNGITIEISALTPLRRVSDPGEIEVGRHGIYIIKGRNRGVLLPQVAIECGFDRDTFLRQTCLKAGLDPASWKEGAEIYVFEAEVFSEGGRG